MQAKIADDSSSLDELPTVTISPRAPLVSHSPRKPFFSANASEEEIPKKRKRKSFILGKSITPKECTAKHGSSESIFDKKQPEKNRRKGRIHSHVGELLLTTEREGFLNFKEKNSKKWHRRWVALSDTLQCHKDIMSDPLLEIPLGYAAVKKNQEKPSQFEVITSNGTYVFSVENEKESADEWIAAVNNVCERLVLNSIENIPGENKESNIKAPVFRCASSIKDPDETALDDILALSKLPQNSTCADCGSDDSEWASTNLGTFICLQCSGVHRSFGTHISQIRSVRLDKWNQSQVNFMAATGNIAANLIWEFSIPKTLERIQPSSSRKQRETWLKLKYINGRFRKDYVDPVVSTEGNIFASLITPQIMKESAISKLSDDPEFCKHLYNIIFDS